MYGAKIKIIATMLHTNFPQYFDSLFTLLPMSLFMARRIERYFSGSCILVPYSQFSPQFVYFSISLSELLLELSTSNVHLCL